MTTAKNGGMSKFMVFRFWKNGSRHFYIWTPGNIVPKVLINPKQMEFGHFLRTGFYRNLSPAERQQGETI